MIQLLNLKILLLLLATVLKQFYFEPLLIVLIYIIPFGLYYILIKPKDFKDFIVYVLFSLTLTLGLTLFIIHILNLWFIPEDIQMKFANNSIYFMIGFLFFLMYFYVFKEYRRKTSFKK